MIKESFSEYLNAWIIVHILNHEFGWGKTPCSVFNMSVGYNMKGILNDNVQWFLDKMSDCKDELAAKKEEIRELCPGIFVIDIPTTISDNITLSTMHGCPANEIEEIAGYFLENKNLHTLVKLNPTLLGPVMLRDILNNKLKFKTIVPDIAFDHDLKYPDAVQIIKSLLNKAKKLNLHFGLKLTNTLESVNNKEIFGTDVEMMYMSGRALHPISVSLARKLQQDFDGELLLSFSAGADAFNISKIISCGFKTATVCSDILKPGGYMRLNQYFEKLNDSIKASGSGAISDFIIRSSGRKSLNDAVLSSLSLYADEVLEMKYYKREYFRLPDIKTKRTLGYFDCISAPCIDNCAANQDIPGYMYYASTGHPDKALEVILRTNPFPSVTGMVCDHLCQHKCTRINYDESLLIREVKRFISGQESADLKPLDKNGLSVAVIGAGPAGLSCAFYLALAGFSVEVFEAKTKAGGMVRYAIPGFRLTDGAIDKDIRRVSDIGVKIHYNSKISTEKFQSLKKDFNYIFIGTGAQLSANLNIDGTDAEGVIDPLDFLFNIRQGKKTEIGKNVVIIGGGNTAMDAARTAYRLVGEDGRVTIVYRRTINEMPADQGEIKAVLEEGAGIIELASPERIIQKEGKVHSVIFSRMELKGIDLKGRPLPVKIESSEFEILCDTVIPAIGQIIDIDFVSGDLLTADDKTYKTKLENILIGGDAFRGASTAINAIGDGRKAAEQIIGQSGIGSGIRKPVIRKGLTRKDLIIRRSKRLFAPALRELPLNDRKNFRLVSQTLGVKDIIQEADRCLFCDEICDICTTVCPNFANYSYKITPVAYNLRKAVLLDNGTIEFQDDKVFEVKQQYQILNIANFCNDCGNCSSFCPTCSAPYKEKPRFYLTISSFNDAEEGYCLSKLKGRKNLIFKQGKSFETLTELTDEYLFETDYLSARFSKEGFKLMEAVFKTPCVKTAQFSHAAEMSILLKGADCLVFG
jgi:putative selenate reductase